MNKLEKLTKNYKWEDIKQYFTRCKYPKKFYEEKLNQFLENTHPESREFKAGPFTIANIFYINAKKSKDRRQRCREEFAKAKFPFYERSEAIMGIDYPGMEAMGFCVDAGLFDRDGRAIESNKKLKDELRWRNKGGCYASHLKLLRMASLYKDGWVIILEDDIQFRHDWDTFIKKVTPLAPYDFIIIESRNGVARAYRDQLTFSKEVANLPQGRGLAGYMVKCSCLSKEFFEMMDFCHTKIAHDGVFARQLSNLGITTCCMSDPMVASYGEFGYQPKKEKSISTSVLAVKLNDFSFNDPHVTDEEIEKAKSKELFNKLKDSWEANSQKNAKWAVLSGKTDWEESEFYERGEEDIQRHFKTIRDADPDVSFEKCLDFGCGVGRLTQALCPHAGEVHGVDIAANMIAEAKSYNKFKDKCHFHLNEKEDLSLFEDNYFNFVVSLIVLQHIPNEFKPRYFSEFSRIIKQHGLIFFNQPIEYVDKEYEKRINTRGVYSGKMWMDVMSKSDLSDMLESNGFKIIESWEKNAGKYKQMFVIARKR